MVTLDNIPSEKSESEALVMYDDSEAVSSDEILKGNISVTDNISIIPT